MRDTNSFLGESIAGYLVESILSEGRLGPVFVGSSSGEQVVIKLLCKQFPEELQRESFLYRGKILAALQHPNIAPLLSYGELDGSFFYTIWPYLRGCDLGEFLEGGALSTRASLQMAHQAALALSAAQRAGIIHATLEAGDIFLLDNDPAKVIVLDFGVGKLVAELGQEARLRERRLQATYNPPMPPSPQYFSPEILMGRGSDKQPDVYALGVILYEALTGRPAQAQGESPLQLLMKVAQGQALLQPDPRISTPVWALLQQMTARQSQQRPSIEQAAKAIATLLAV